MPSRAAVSVAALLTATLTALLPAPPPAAAADNGPTPRPARPAPAPGFLTVVCNPACDEVLDGNRSLGTSPVVHRAVPAGSHVLTLRRAGQTPRKITANVQSGKVNAVRVDMSTGKASAPPSAPPSTPPTKSPPTRSASPHPKLPPPKPDATPQQVQVSPSSPASPDSCIPPMNHQGATAAQSQSGWVTLVCSPACSQILLDGRSLGTSPLVRVPMPAGSHTITALRPGEPSQRLNIHVAAGKNTNVRVSRAGTDASLPSPQQPFDAEARALLEPKVWSGNATIDEIRVLRAICSHQGDRECRDRATELLNQRTAPHTP